MARYRGTGDTGGCLGQIGVYFVAAAVFFWPAAITNGRWYGWLLSVVWSTALIALLRWNRTSKRNERRKSG
jgi:hypothetical protein